LIEDDNMTEGLLTALGNPLRRDVLRTLIDAETPMSPKELAALHQVNINLMSHHVRKLVAAEMMMLVDTRRSARGAPEHFYRPGPASDRPLVRDALGRYPEQAAA
jgi:DNA-binding transcriptional ArsR family regulator